MITQQRRQQRSGAISLPPSTSQGRLQRFFGRFTRAPANLIGQARRKSVALLNPQAADESTQAEIAALLLRQRPQLASLKYLEQRTRFSSCELKAIYRRFKSECPYGLMQEEVLEQILAQIFPLGNVHTFSHFVFGCFDWNRTGSVNFEQFVLCLNILLKGNREERVRWIFSMYDINRDGEVNRRELHEIVNSVYELMGTRVEPTVTAADVEQHTNEAFRRLDTDGDGVISWEDFKDYFARNPHLLDGMDALLSQIS